jgi:hypothetical protein
VAEFYSLWRSLFYRRGVLQCGGFKRRFVRLHVRFEIEKIVNRMSEILFATEVAFGRLYRRMSQEELNLLKLAAVTVAECTD